MNVLYQNCPCRRCRYSDLNQDETHNMKYQSYPTLVNTRPAWGPAALINFEALLIIIFTKFVDGGDVDGGGMSDNPWSDNPWSDNPWSDNPWINSIDWNTQSIIPLQSMGYRRIISTSKSILHAPNLIYLRIIKVNRPYTNFLAKIGSRFPDKICMKNT